MSDSILSTTKKVLGLDVDNTDFDVDVIMHINSVFATLHQLGIGPSAGYAIEDNVPTWTNFLDTSPLLNSARSYVYLKVRMLFDPPTTSFLIAAMEKQIEELEWRMNLVYESKKTPVVYITPPRRSPCTSTYTVITTVQDGVQINVPTASATWIIPVPDGFDSFPVVTVYDTDGEVILADVEVTSTIITVTFANPTSGYIVLS